MNKKVLGLLVSVVAVFALSGCGGGGGSDYYVDPVDPALTTLFLIDQDGNSYAGIPYLCDSMYDWEYTKANGEFTFSPPDNCEFDFTGLVGNYNDDPYIDDIVYIVDDLDNPKPNIPYECSYFGASSTYSDGSFDYDADDRCTFYL